MPRDEKCADLLGKSLLAQALFYTWPCFVVKVQKGGAGRGKREGGGGSVEGECDECANNGMHKSEMCCQKWENNCKSDKGKQQQ